MNDRPSLNAAWLGADSPSAELLELCEQLCEMTITSSDLSRLETILNADPKSRAFYTSYVRLHGALHWAANHETTETSVDAKVAVLPTSDAEGTQFNTLPVVARTNLFRFSKSSTTSARTAALLVIGLFLIGGVMKWRTNVALEQQKAGAVAVAELRSAQDCVWKDSAELMVAGGPLNSGQRLNLVRGVAKLAFKNGTSVVVEGPAAFELATATSMRLDHGTVAVRANGPVKDFTVDSREASIVDLGTSFGVHCDELGATEVEVFEGAVELYPQAGQDRAGRVLGLGSSARIHSDATGAGLDVTASKEDRFGNLIEQLWKDLPSCAENSASDDGGEVVEAHFHDAPNPGTVDTFYGAIPGRGWLTPWVAAGNPRGDVRLQNPLNGEDDPYLQVQFSRSNDRAIAREYGPRPGFDPSEPHVISWKWRFEGSESELGTHFRDRVYFYGNPSFRRNSWPTNSWLIGVVGGNEKGDKRRKVFPKNWFIFDGSKDGDGAFDRKNMVDSGMKLKAGIVYQFAVAVYPQLAKYDVAIRDDQKTFVRSGMNFRNKTAGSANVLHFGIGSSLVTSEAGFSLDALKIARLNGVNIEDSFTPSYKKSGNVNVDQEQ